MGFYVSELVVGILIGAVGTLAAIIGLAYFAAMCKKRITDNMLCEMERLQMEKLQ
jgi:hypothetical protein